MKRHPAAMAAVGLVLVLSACGGSTDDPTTPAPTATSPTTASPTTDSPTTAPSPAAPTASPTPTTAAPAPETTAPDGAVAWSTAAQSSPGFPGAGGELLPVGVRVGDHEGYERVVFDLDGTGIPDWRVQYVDEAIEDPSGLSVDVDGDAILEVVATGLRYPEESEYDSVLGSGTIDVEETDEVEEIRVGGLFEGHLQAFVGLDSQLPFRVFTLADPVRLVIDVQTD